MSFNNQDNAQNAAVAPGSDTDSVSSLSSHIADMHLGGSSSPAKQSSIASDEEGDITIIKDTSVAGEGEDEEGQVPFYDKFGAPVNEDTLPENFASWPEYLLFCKQGPKLKIRLAVLDEMGEAVCHRKIDYSKKMLCDHSDYFRGLYRTGLGMREFSVGYLDLDDVNVVHFERLVMLISSGHPEAPHNIGPSWTTLSDLLQCSFLCDRLAMDRIGGWIKKMMNDYMQEMGNWSARYHHDVIAHPNAGLEEKHRDRVLDVADAYQNSIRYEDEKLPVQSHRYVSFLITACPRVLLAEMVDEFPPQLIVALTKEMLVPTI
ncbi:hypothetical protein N8I77_001005 [Diaporthe amygdali]|uniref:BTB domain-containing protein n=1 Tax=Phomopsis amygdali TaxID=1214568 RepID=A0AAD9SN85_PHOAM|nr:hypothetical protein N8I77_001005 [Diaporthe amygdali]